MTYIPANKLISEIKTRQSELVEHIKTDTPSERAIDGSKTVELQWVLDIITSLQQDETQVDKMLCSQAWWEEQGWIMIPPDATVEGIDSLLRQVRKKLQQEQSKEQLIQVKCISPYDESWEKDKIYTCNVWHHGSLNIDFWDVYYDYGNKPNYVQFSSIEMLNKEFAIIQQEQPEVDLEKEIEEHTVYMPHGEFTSDNEVIEDMEWARKEFRYFYELGLNARKEK